MRLLTKQETNQKRSEERKMEIDEGMKLARKIDTLRETSATEEDRLAKFREQSLKQTREQISALLIEKEAMENELVTLEARKREALKPLTAEMDSLTLRRSEITAFGASLDTKRQELDRIEQKLRDFKADLLEKERILTQEAQLIAVEVEKVKDLIIFAEKTVAEAEQKRGQTNVELDVKKKTAEAREKALNSLESDLKNREQVMLKKEKALSDRERLVRDREETLIRTINRIKK